MFNEAYDPYPCLKIRTKDHDIPPLPKTPACKRGWEGIEGRMNNNGERP